ncbi:MAG: hypothetical protein LQ341_001065 [Variospora aurantia]|nr:MAG: hypothetical protein LQ341_001065 [Variospora aurantia]
MLPLLRPTLYHLRQWPHLSRRLLLSTFLTLLTWFPVVWFLNHDVIQLMRVTGPSMYPFLNTDHNTTTQRDVVAVNMWKPGQQVRRGDVVVFRSPMDPQTIAVKRVVAVEGDRVVTRAPCPVAEQEVSLGHVWVEGEHPEGARWSYDSNSYGALDRRESDWRGMALVATELDQFRRLARQRSSAGKEAG